MDGRVWVQCASGCLPTRVRTSPPEERVDEYDTDTDDDDECAVEFTFGGECWSRVGVWV